MCPHGTFTTAKTGVIREGKGSSTTGDDEGKSGTLSCWQMSGSVCYPIQEDEIMFLINSISREHYKGKGSSGKKKPIWVHKLRPRFKNLESVISRPVSGAVVCLLDGRVLNFLPLSSMDTFKSVYDALYIVFSKKEYITKIIETLSFLEVDSNKRPSRDNNTQLMIKVIFDALVISFQRTLIQL